MNQTNRITEAFGPHLVMDGYGCPPEVLSNLDLLYEFLNTMPDTMGMTKIMPPYVFKYRGKVLEDWGLSGFVLIAESHISVHTFPDKGYVSIDAFSCKDFDHAKFRFIAAKMFQIQRVDAQLLERGLEFPRNVEVVRDHMTEERATLHA